MNMIYYNENLDMFLLCVNEIKKLCDSLGKDIKKVINSDGKMLQNINFTIDLRENCNKYNE